MALKGLVSLCDTAIALDVPWEGVRECLPSRLVSQAATFGYILAAAEDVPDKAFSAEETSRTRGQRLCCAGRCRPD